MWIPDIPARPVQFVGIGINRVTANISAGCVVMSHTVIEWAPSIFVEQPEESFVLLRMELYALPCDGLMTQPGLTAHAY